MQLVADGLSNKLIAQRLNIEVATVKCHVHHMLDKLKFHRRSNLALWVCQRAPDLEGGVCRGTRSPRFVRGGGGGKGRGGGKGVSGGEVRGGGREGCGEKEVGGGGFPRVGGEGSGRDGRVRRGLKPSPPSRRRA